MKSHRLLLCASLLAISLYASETLHIQNTFDGEWTISEGKTSSIDGVRTALPEGFSLEKHEDGNGGYLHVGRAECGLREVPFQRLWNIPDFHDFRLHLRCRGGKLPKAYMEFRSADGKSTLGGINFNNGRILAYDATQKWTDSGIALPPSGEWFELDVRFDVSQKAYSIQMQRADGSTVDSLCSFPFLSAKGVRKITLGNIPPAGSGFDFDALELHVTSEMVSANRADGTHGAIVKANGIELQHEDGVLSHDERIALPATIDIAFVRPIPLCSLLLHLQGKTPNLAVEFYGQDAAGSGRQLLLKRTIARGTDKILEENFVSSELQNAQLVITGDSESIGLRQLRVLGAILATDNEKAQIFRNRVTGEFRSAYWQEQREAHLHLFNGREDGGKQRVRISAATRDGGSAETMIPSQETSLEPGRNVIAFPLEKVAPGEYVITIADASGESDGKLQRVLRYFPKFATSPLAPGIISMDGKKMLFPDGHYFEHSSGLEFQGGRAEVVEAIPASNDNADFTRIGTAIARDGDGRVFIDYFTLNRNWDHDSKHFYRAYCDNLAENKWESTELPSKPSWHDGSSIRVGELPPEEATPDWDYKGSRKPEQYQFYDAAKHGPIDITQLKFRYSGAVANNTLMWKGSTQDWGCMKAIPRATYKIWRKSPDESLVVDEKPMLTDRGVAGDIEDPDNTHDNFVGQWLSNDGKTLYFAHARWLKANPPYESPAYDNMDGLRLINIWKTTDGINCEQTVMLPPTEEDMPAAQQYGATVLRLRGGNGLFLAFVLRYRGEGQQIDVELGYSWDGGCWSRVPGPVFLENGPFGSISAGCITIHWDDMHPLLSTVEDETYAYQILSRVDGFYHFQAAQICDFIPNIDHLDEDFIRRTLGQRNIEKWPYFKEAGGYPGLARHCRTAGESVAYAKYRRDGWFCASAGPEGASAVTVPVTAHGRLSANIVVGEGGSAEFVLTDAGGKALPGYVKTVAAGADKTAAVLFETLPQGPFRIQLKLSNARLYALSFDK